MQTELRSRASFLQHCIVWCGEAAENFRKFPFCAPLWTAAWANGIETVEWKLQKWKIKKNSAKRKVQKEKWKLKNENWKMKNEKWNENKFWKMNC